MASQSERVDEEGVLHGDRLAGVVNSSRLLTAVLARWNSIDLPNAFLSGSALAQTCWNLRFGYLCTHGISDIDIVYFDPGLSGEAENSHALRVSKIFDDFPVQVDVKNQARVHHWYGRKFGHEIAPYKSVETAIDNFPTTASAVGIRPGSTGLSVYAPFGLNDLLGCVVRPNKSQITQDIYEAKIVRWRALWPALECVPWGG